MNKIMIVDDSQFTRFILRNIFLENGLDVVAEATDGYEAIDLYQKFQPDLVTMDLTMPGIDGLSTLRAIRTLDPEARIIMVTAIGYEKAIKQAFVLGALDFIVKPLQKERIISSVYKHLKSSDPLSNYVPKKINLG